MRDYRFLLWDKENKQMNEVDVIDWGEKKIITKSLMFYQDYDSESNFILLEYIGLKDQNKNPIYNGFILKGELGLLAVEWSEEEASFYCYDEYTGKSYYFGRDINTSEYEIIGDIFRSSELLKSE